MKYIPLLLSILLFAACKKPQASFVHDYVVPVGGTDEYLKAGDTARFINTSKDAHHYVWHLPDGTTTGSKDLTFVVDTFAQQFAPLIITLTAYNKNGEKSSSASLTYKASPFHAPTVLWMQTGSPHAHVKLALEGDNLLIDTLYSSQPQEPYRLCPSGNMLLGNHYYEAYDAITLTQIGSGTFNVNPRIINFIKIQ